MSEAYGNGAKDDWECGDNKEEDKEKDEVAEATTAPDAEEATMPLDAAKTDAVTTPRKSPSPPPNEDEESYCQVCGLSESETAAHEKVLPTKLLIARTNLALSGLVAPPPCCGSGANVRSLLRRPSPQGPWKEPHGVATAGPNGQRKDVGR